MKKMKAAGWAVGAEGVLIFSGKCLIELKNVMSSVKAACSLLHFSIRNMVYELAVINCFHIM